MSLVTQASACNLLLFFKMGAQLLMLKVKSHTCAHAHTHTCVYFFPVGRKRVHVWDYCFSPSLINLFIISTILPEPNSLCCFNLLNEHRLSVYLVPRMGLGSEQISSRTLRTLRTQKKEWLKKDTWSGSYSKERDRG